MEERKTGKILVILLAGFMAALILLSVAVFIVVQREARSNAANNEVEPVVSQPLEDKLEDIRGLIDRYYLFDGSETDFDTAIIKGYVDALGDPYTVYYTPEEYNDLLESSSGVFYGIGALLQQDMTTMKIHIVRAYRNTPAAEAGLKTDDEITAINGEKLTDEDLSLVVTRIRGEAGTDVTLTIFRPSTGETFDKTITRRKVEVESATGEMLDANGRKIGYIQLESFDEVTYRQFSEAFFQLKSDGMESLIIDLRDNGGGLVSSVTAISDMLLPAGVITYTIDKNGNREEYSSDAFSTLDVPCVLLVNGNTASASEIMTGAMQYYGAAKVVGTQTFGKGIVQSIISLEDGSGIKITVSRYYTPADVCIHEIGLTPDVVLEDDPETEEDEQLEKAIGLLAE